MSDRIAVMDHGRILQLGTPEDIYDRPATRFVADFIGETNLIPAVCRAVVDGHGQVALGDGSPLEVAGLNGHGAGEAMTLAVRPERVELVAADEPAAIPVTVDTIVYMGSDTVCHLRLRDGTKVRARLQNRRGAIRALEPGAAAAVRIPPDAARALGD